MKKQILAAGAGGLLSFVLVGGLWVGLVQLIPAGIPRSIFIIALGFAFAGTYLWLVIARVRVILAGTTHLLRHALIAGAEVVLLLFAFGAVYHRIGIIDNTQSGSPVVHEFWSSLYYSAVTFTTLGYGDFYPVGAGRALAAMQALTGYIILGVLASTTASAVSPHSKAGLSEEQDEEQ
jgi:hypothetical protein